jgi:hypothetical protein
MHPIFHDELIKARIADLHREAKRDRLAWAFRQARRTRREHRNDPAGGRAARVIARRLLIIMGARGA